MRRTSTRRGRVVATIGVALVLLVGSLPTASAAGAVFNKLTLLSPAGNANAVAYSRGGGYMAIGSGISGGTNTLTVYSHSGSGTATTFAVAFTDTTDWPSGSTGVITSVAFSHDDTLVCVSYGSGAKILNVPAGTLAQTVNVLGNTNGKGCSWSYDDSKFAYANSAVGQGSLLVWNTSAGLPTGTNTATGTHATGGTSVQFAPSTYQLAYGTSNTPFVQVLAYTGTIWSVLSTPTAGDGTNIQTSWLDDTALASAQSAVASHVNIWTANATTLSRQQQLTPSGIGFSAGVAYSPNGTQLAVAGLTSPGIVVYSRSGTTYTNIASPVDVSPGAAGSGSRTIGWDATSMTMAFAGGNSNATIYAQVTPDAPTNVTVVPNPVANGTGGCVSLNWTAAGTGSAATGYSVFYSQGSGHATANPMNTSDYSFLKHVDGVATTACGLASGADYHFRIVGTSASGEGAPSADANNTTVAGMPTFVVATGSSTTSVVVNWTVNIFIQKATGYSVFYKASPEGTPTYPLNASGYTFSTHVQDPTHQATVMGLSTNSTYCFRVESTNQSAGGEGDVSTTVACATTGNITSPPVLSGVYVPCQTFALSWTLPNGTIDGYRIDQSTPSLPFVNRSFFVPPDGNFTLRLLNVSFPQISGELDYAAFAHTAAGYSASSNVVNFTPPAVSTIGDCGLQWGGTSASDFAAQAGVPVSAAQVMVSVFLIVMGAGIGLVAMGNGAGVAGGVGAGLLISVALGLVPTWAVMFALVAGAALGIAGAMLGVGNRALRRGGLGR